MTGLNEFLTKTIKGMLSMYVGVERKTWEEALRYVTFAYDTAVQETTETIPLECDNEKRLRCSMLPHLEDDLNADAQGFLPNSTSLYNRRAGPGSRTLQPLSKMPLVSLG